MRKQSGWYARISLRDEPRVAGDLVVPMAVKANFEMDHLYANEEDAWQAVEQHLTRQREAARRNLDLLARPSKPALKNKRICPPERVAQWRAEAREELRIAEKGLAICAARKPAPTGTLMASSCKTPENTNATKEAIVVPARRASGR